MKYTFLFALGNERTLVTCKSCEVQSVSQRLTRDQCPFISQCKQKSVLQSLYLCWSDETNPKKSEKSCCMIMITNKGRVFSQIFQTNKINLWNSLHHVHFSRKVIFTAQVTCMLKIHHKHTAELFHAALSLVIVRTCMAKCP